MKMLQSDISLAMPDLRLSTNTAELERYSTDESGCTGVTPIALVRPDKVSQIQQLVQLCRLHAVHLQVVSSAAPHYRGDTLCRENSILVDMSLFDEVVRVDRRNRVVMFEAGVSFEKLVTASREQALRPLLPLCPRPGKSALAAYLEREPTMYPRFQWDLSDPLLCTEVIFGSGEFFRTGEAAGPGTLEEQWQIGHAQKTPIGPGHSDIARILQGAQGNLGIVTWCTAKAEPIPKQELLYVVETDKLHNVVEFAYGLMKRNHPDICFIVDNSAMAAIKDRTPSNKKLDASDAAQQHSNSWCLVFSIAESAFCGEDRTAYIQEEIAQLCDQHAVKATLCDSQHRYRGLHDILTNPSNHCNQQGWWKHAGRTGTRELFFNTTLDNAEKYIQIVNSIAKKFAWNDKEILVYLQPLLGGRCCHLEFVFPHAAEEKKTRDFLDKMLKEMVRQLSRSGAYFSRPYGPITAYARRDAAADKLMNRLKQVFDPDEVMSSSAWPVIGQSIAG